MKGGLTNAMWRLGLAAAVAAMAGCASVKSTAQYYIPTSTKTYPPKPADATIPIIGRPPAEKHTVIGRLAFQTDQGWKFLRKSMEYNARMNGADAVVLRGADTQERRRYNYVPPQMDFVPSTGYYRRGGRTYGYTTWIPYYTPGYVVPWIERITAIDAEMIVMKK